MSKKLHPKVKVWVDEFKGRVKTLKESSSTFYFIDTLAKKLPDNYAYSFFSETVKKPLVAFYVKTMKEVEEILKCLHNHGCRLESTEESGTQRRYIFDKLQVNMNFTHDSECVITERVEEIQVTNKRKIVCDDEPTITQLMQYNEGKEPDNVL